ncbi:AP2 domain transcription factor AP2X-5 [Cardiosporidium cionae]|uniref:AP2 domain transcription factor AP2X-5 n=1 Tax=Cardiosporidium cionae TaxID=476202 RepID=A0ABQ7JCU4_9APIC|nr:AP2 domain transcription factor AP2X-5 [Cardiosporidium cionae]|eukprot:KAF8821818.1 AP2 domain transcription factor AP2X-5 [Cardiosporidium cionae]
MTMTTPLEQTSDDPLEIDDIDPCHKVSNAHIQGLEISSLKNSVAVARSSESIKGMKHRQFAGAGNNFCGDNDSVDAPCSYSDEEQGGVRESRSNSSISSKLWKELSEFATPGEVSLKSRDTNIHQQTASTDAIASAEKRVPMERDVIEALQDLQHLSTLTRPRDGLPKRVNVGAKPFSGVRGIYFQQGLWKVKYKGNNEAGVRVFPYKTVEEMRKQFFVAKKFLHTVIGKGRQLHDSDGEGLSNDEATWEHNPKIQRIFSGSNSHSKKNSHPITIKKKIAPEKPKIDSEVVQQPKPAAIQGKKQQTKKINIRKQKNACEGSPQRASEHYRTNYFQTFIAHPLDRSLNCSCGPRHEKNELYFAQNGAFLKSCYNFPSSNPFNPQTNATQDQISPKSFPSLAQANQELNFTKSANLLTDCSFYSPIKGMSKDEIEERHQKWKMVAAYPFKCTTNDTLENNHFKGCIKKSEIKTSETGSSDSQDEFLSNAALFHIECAAINHEYLHQSTDDNLTKSQLRMCSKETRICKDGKCYTKYEFVVPKRLYKPKCTWDNFS